MVGPPAQNEPATIRSESAAHPPESRLIGLWRRPWRQAAGCGADSGASLCSFPVACRVVLVLAGQGLSCSVRRPATFVRNRRIPANSISLAALPAAPEALPDDSNERLWRWGALSREALAMSAELASCEAQAAEAVCCVSVQFQEPGSGTGISRRVGAAIDLGIGL